MREITRRFQQEARNQPAAARSSSCVAAIQSRAPRDRLARVEHNLLETPRTTCVACIVQNGRAYWAHAGDSRLYLLRQRRADRARRSDHSKVQQLIDAGVITRRGRRDATRTATRSSAAWAASCRR